MEERASDKARDLGDVFRDDALLRIGDDDEDLFELIFKNAMIGIGISDLNGNPMIGNEMSASILGYPHDEILGMNVKNHYYDINDRDCLFAEFLDKGCVRNAKVKLKRQDGTPFWALLSISPILYKGDPAFFSTILDIDQSESARDLADRSYEMFRNIVDGSPNGMHMYTIDENDRLIFSGANRSADKILGIDNSKLIGKTIEEAFPPLADTEIPSRYIDAARNGISWSTEQVDYEDDKINGAFEVHAFQTAPGQMVATFRDITERKRREMAVRASEDRYRTLFDESLDTIYITDMDGTIVDMNPSGVELLGLSRKELIGTSAYDFYVNPSDRDHFMVEIKDVGFVRDYDVRLKKADGTEMDCVLISTIRLDDEGVVVGYQGIIRDLTEQRTAEQALQVSEEKYRALVERATDAIVILQEGEIKYANPRLSEFGGYGLDEMIGQNFLMFAQEEERERLIDHYTRRMAGEEVEKIYESKLLHKDGSTVPVEINAGLTTYDGKPADLILVRNIAERKRTESELEKSKEDYRTVVENAGEAIVVAQNGIILFCNRMSETITGFTVEELVGMSFQDFVHPDDLRMVAKHHQNRLDGSPDLEGYVFRLITKDQNVRWIEVNSVLIDWEGQPATLSFSKDVTVRIEAENQLKQHMEDMAFLSSSAMELVEFPSSENLFDLIGNRIHEMTGDSFVIISTMDESGDNLKIRTIHGLGDKLRTVLRLIGRDPIGMSFPKADPEKYSIVQGKVTELPMDIADLSSGKIPGPVAKAIKKALNVGALYTIDFNWKGDIFGSATIATLGNERIEDPSLLEAYIGQMSVALHKWMAENALWESQRTLSTLMSNLPGMAYRSHNDRKWTMAFVSEGARELTGYDPDDIMDNKVVSYDEMVFDPDRERVEEEIRNSLDRKEPFEITYRIRTKSGEEKWVWEKGTGVFYKDGELSALEGFIIDVTDQITAEGRIKASLRDKEVLLKEIHHRVKNNLQIISSLLHLQSRSATDPAVEELFRASRNRVKAMGLAHEKIYESPDLSNVDFDKYVKTQVSEIFRSYPESSGVRLEVECSDVHFGLDTAIPLGLILNELVSNALKHAFPDRQEGKINISIVQSEGLGTSIAVTDNGVGIPEDTDPFESESLGLQLVDSLVKQIGGRIELERVDGTRWTITI